MAQANGKAQRAANLTLLPGFTSIAEFQAEGLELSELFQLKRG